MKKGFTLIELLIVIAIIAILAAIAVPNFLEAQVRAKVSRVKSDQRSLATGLEAYYVDCNSYPSHWWKGEPGGGANGFSGTGTGAGQIHTLKVRTGPVTGANLFFMLTTPISYLTNFFEDPFAATNGATYAYYAQKSGWIVWSFGPDTDEATDSLGDIEYGINESLYDSRVTQPSLTLIVGGTASGASQYWLAEPDHGSPRQNNAFTYDPTNGTTSEGDVWRVKQ